MIGAEDREMLRRSVEACVGRFSGPELDRQLVSLGWLDALSVDRPAAVSILFDGLGRAGATSSMLAALMLEAAGLPPAPLILPVPGASQPAGTVDGREIRVRGVALGPAGPAEEVFVPIAGACAVAPAADLDWGRVGSLDPDLGLVEVHGSLDATVRREELDWDAALAAGRNALSYQIVGAARAMLSLACRHALDRHQGGHPIARYQAVRHRLADAFVEVEGASALAEAAWETGTAGAALSKAAAGRAGRAAARHCQQVLGGLGFTTEHPLHRYIRRVVVLDSLLGSAAALERELGAAARLAGMVPPVLPL